MTLQTGSHPRSKLQNHKDRAVASQAAS